jgi:hypothetical protein
MMAARRVCCELRANQESKTFGEPIVDRCQYSSHLVMAILGHPQALEREGVDTSTAVVKVCDTLF